MKSFYDYLEIVTQHNKTSVEATFQMADYLKAAGVRDYDRNKTYAKFMPRQDGKKILNLYFDPVIDQNTQKTVEKKFQTSGDWDRVQNQISESSYNEETKVTKECDNCGGEVRHKPSPKYNPDTGNVSDDFQPYACNGCKKSFNKKEFDKLPKHTEFLEGETETKKNPYKNYHYADGPAYSQEKEKHDEWERTNNPGKEKNARVQHEKEKSEIWKQIEVFVEKNKAKSTGIILAKKVVDELLKGKLKDNKSRIEGIVGSYPFRKLTGLRVTDHAEAQEVIDYIWKK